MTIDDINAIRLALDTPEHNRHYVSHTTDAKIILNKKQAEQLNIADVSKFDMQKFKEYVNTYDKRKNGLDNDETIVKDMLYGIGLCLDKEQYCYAGGYKKFKAFLKAFL